MISQNIHTSLSGACPFLRFSEGELSQIATILPKGAKVFHISVQVKTAGSGSLSLGFEDSLDAVASKIDLGSTATHIINYAATPGTDLKLIATASENSDAEVEIIVVWLDPSVVMVEHNIQ